MRAVVMHEPGNVTVEELPKPTILEPTDAIIKLAATCICGSDLWPYRGMEPVHEQRMGHEYVGTVVEVGGAVTTVRPGGHLSFVGVPHGVSLDMSRMFLAEVHMFGGPAAVRKYLPTMINLIMSGTINPGAVFDMVLPLEQAAEGYAAMDERRATKVMLTV